MFLIIFHNFHSSSFPNILSKMYEEIFLEAFGWSNDFIMHYRLFSGKLPTISEYSQEFFFLESVLLKSEILHYRAEALEKRGQFRNDFLWIFKILEDVFLSEHFQNVSVVHFGSRL